jgi:hypothetical protein
MRLQERFLHQVGGVELHAQRVFKQRAGDQPRIVAVKLEQQAQGGDIARTGLAQRQLGDRV